jgi:subtilase family serine protease
MWNRVKKLVGGTAGGKRRTSGPLTVESLEARDVPSTAPLTPLQVRHAYGVDQASYVVNGRIVQGDGTGQTIAIVDQYHDPYVSRDLQTFDRQYGLPDPVFAQYSYTNVSNDHWSQETALDVEWAHAIAPRANILLVEAAPSSNDAQFLANMFAAVNWARQQPGVSTVSMSWGTPDWGTPFTFNAAAYDATLTTPAGHNGITFVASSGDSGAQDNYPAMSPHVVAVGGTNLSVDAWGDYLGETAWGGSGGGYSPQEREPAFQQGVQNTGYREGPDVAYDASTPVSTAWTQPSTGAFSWIGMTGTSAGAPQWAALIAIADQVRAASGGHTLDGPSQTLYALYSGTMTGDFHDVTVGSNGYRAAPGYDLATGRGTPYAQRVILDLARVSDAFHGAVAVPGGLKAAQAPGKSAAQTGSPFAAPASHACPADPGAKSTILSPARARTTKTAPDPQAADAVFLDGLWL